jgi:antitoxin Phd
MKIFTRTEARQKLASLLEHAAKYGEVRIKRRDGQVFVFKPQKRKGSPLAVVGIKTKLSCHEMLQSIEERGRSFLIELKLQGGTPLEFFHV